MKQRELVTGSAGSPGYHLGELLLARRHGVLCVDSSFDQSGTHISDHMDDPRLDQQLEAERQEIDAADSSVYVISPRDTLVPGSRALAGGQD